MLWLDENSILLPKRRFLFLIFAGKTYLFELISFTFDVCFSLSWVKSSSIYSSMISFFSLSLSIIPITQTLKINPLLISNPPLHPNSLNSTLKDMLKYRHFIFNLQKQNKKIDISMIRGRPFLCTVFPNRQSLVDSWTIHTTHNAQRTKLEINI